VAFLVGLALAALQATFLHFVGGGSFSLALPLTVVVYLGLWAGNVDGVVGAAAVGYVQDLMAGGPKGLMTSLAVVLFLASRVTGAALSVHSKTGFALLCTVGTFLYGLVALLFIRAVSPAESAPQLALVGRLLVEALLTGALSPLVMLTLRRLDALLEREDPNLLTLR
jgi:sugar phosphate permease